MKTKTIAAKVRTDAGATITVQRRWRKELGEEQLSVDEYFTEIRCGPMTLRLYNNEAQTLAKALVLVATAPEPKE